MLIVAGILVVIVFWCVDVLCIESKEKGRTNEQYTIAIAFVCSFFRCFLFFFLFFIFIFLHYKHVQRECVCFFPNFFISAPYFALTHFFFITFIRLRTYFYVVFSAYYNIFFLFFFFSFSRMDTIKMKTRNEHI